MKLIHNDYKNELPKLNDISLIIADIPYENGFDYSPMFNLFNFSACLMILVDNNLNAFQTFFNEASIRFSWLYHGIWLHDGNFTSLLGFVNKNDKRSIQTSSIVHFKKVRATNHPEERPVELMEYIINNFSLGGLVVDPFMGSGSSGVAAKKNGINYIGIEMNNEYFDAARDRIWLS